MTVQHPFFLGVILGHGGRHCDLRESGPPGTRWTAIILLGHEGHLQGGVPITYVLYNATY